MSAPTEGSSAAKRASLQVSFPLPDGTLQYFYVWDAPVMEEALANKFPEIKSYSGRGIENPSVTMRMNIGPDGFHAILLTANGGSLIIPYAFGQNNYYICYSHADTDWQHLAPNALKCGVGDKEMGFQNFDTRRPIELRDGGDEKNTELRKYRFALSCTGEYGVAKGGSKAAVLSTLVTATNTINAILERDAGIRLMLIANNDLIVFTDPATDPYNNANNGGGLLRQNEEALNSILGLSGYDIGHVFTTGCSDVGGVVNGTACSSAKGRGVTCHSSSNVVGVTLNIAVHEVGHQFSAGHTYNNCPGLEGQLASGSAFEPGSGSTFLSYQRACSGSNIPGAANLHYHGGTMEQIWRYSRQTGGNICPEILTSPNRAPMINLPYSDGFYIPISTPFELTALATDADKDPLTYCWEQVNLGPSVELGSPAGNSPLFRTFDPSNSPNRIFPRLDLILRNENDITEVLPTYTRNLKFRVTVRDNNIADGAGGFSWKDISFESTASAGPFLVKFPNSADVTLKSGQKVDVTWDVSNTHLAPVNCQSVNIRLSTDGGLTYPHLLAGYTSNDGVESVYIPGITSSKARIKVEAANSIFFDISNADFKIDVAEKPTYTIAVSPQIQQICVPAIVNMNISTSAVLNFDKPIFFDFAGEFHKTATYKFSKNQIEAGQTTSVSFDFSKVLDDGIFEPVLRAISSTDTILVKLHFNLVYSDFSKQKLLEPANGASKQGLLPVFRWQKLSHADNYEFQLSSSPLFSQADILAEGLDITVDSFLPKVALKESTIYYWRIRPGNECGKADWSMTHAFQTFNLSCDEFVSSDVPKTISSIGLPVVQSVLTVLDNNIITDLNVANIKGTHDALPHISISLKSPKGTEVELFSKICGNVALFNFGLDDEAPFAIACPPTNGLKYKPQNPLSVFKGESTFGNWTLTLKVINTDGQGGSLEKWSLEFCGPVTPKNPFLSKLDTLRVQPGETRIIQDSQLSIQDEDDSPFQLKLTILNLPLHGNLLLNGLPMKIGGSFTMADITAGKISYSNINKDAFSDSFSFIAEDGNGGWLGTPVFPIRIGKLTTSDEDVYDIDMLLTLFPNPASERLTVLLPEEMDITSLQIMDSQGRTINTQYKMYINQELTVDTSLLPAGFYMLALEAGEFRWTKKFVVMRN